MMGICSKSEVWWEVRQKTDKILSLMYYLVSISIK